MPSATIDASEILFPPVCARCGGPPETMHELDARKGVDLIFVHYHQFISLSVPLCRPCQRRRRTVGLLAWTADILFILVGGFFVMVFVMNEWRTAAIALGLVVGAATLLGRLGLDDLVEWSTLGLRVVWRRGEGVPLTVHFRDPEYFATWAALNPSASVVP